MSEQVPTMPATTPSIMRTAAFARGLSDVRNGVPFDWTIDSWNYERGRLFGHIAPLDMPLHVGTTLNPKALALCDAAFSRKLIV